MAELVAQHGEGAVHATQSQNLVLRCIRDSELETAHSKLTALGLADPVPAILRDLVACAGASTGCRGLCQSRGLAEALTQRLQSGVFVRHQLGGARVNISGCLNACGRHPIGNIGLYGAARRVDDKLVPYPGTVLGFGPLLAEAIRVSGSPDPEQGMTVDTGVVSGLVAAVTRLYQTMDASPRFKSSTRSEALGVR